MLGALYEMVEVESVTSNAVVKVMVEQKSWMAFLW